MSEPHAHNPPSFDLTGKVALVTGASSGLGRHFARTLAGAGATVAAAARRADKLTELVDDINAAGGKAQAFPLDVVDRDSVTRALDDIVAQLGSLDVLVNNAGVGGGKRPLDYDDDDWQQIVGTNLTGAWLVAQESARRMADAGTGGAIVNITSILSNRVAPGVGPYCAAKAGLQHLTRSLAVELARHDIRVNSLAPGYVITDMNRDFLTSESGERMRARVPMRAFGRCEDLDGPLLLLASPAGGFMTGSEIVVDGGHQCSAL